MTRIRELIKTIAHKYPRDPFFGDFEESCTANAAKRVAYRTYDDALRVLDPTSWEVLKNKAVAHFKNERWGQLKQGLFNQLNEAFAYRHLVQRGYLEVVMLPESGQSTPDIRYIEAGRVKHCEVKTLGLSDEEIVRRESGRVFTNAYDQLSEGFFRKLASDIDAAEAQIKTKRTSGLVYLVVDWDDIAVDYYPQYRRQVISFCGARAKSDVYVKVGLRGNRRMHITKPCTQPPPKLL